MRTEIYRSKAVSEDQNQHAETVQTGIHESSDEHMLILAGKIEALESPVSLFNISESVTAKGQSTQKLKLSAKGKRAAQDIYKDLYFTTGSHQEVLNLIKEFRGIDEKGRYKDDAIKKRFTGGEKRQATLQRRAVKRLLNSLAAKARYEQNRIRDEKYVRQATRELMDINFDGKVRNPSAAKLSKKIKELKKDEQQNRFSILQSLSKREEDLEIIDKKAKLELQTHAEPESSGSDQITYDKSNAEIVLLPGQEKSRHTTSRRNLLRMLLFAGVGVGTLGSAIKLAGRSSGAQEDHAFPNETVAPVAVLPVSKTPTPVLSDAAPAPIVVKQTETNLTPALPEKPVNLINELFKPFIDQAKRKRAERMKDDPEFSKRVDQELNADRINFAVLGIGEEHGESYADMGGSMLVMSYDLKSQQVGSISLSRDIRAPELEQTLPENERKWMVLRHVYKVGGFPLMRKTVENATGLCPDFQIVLKDTVVMDAIDSLADKSIELDVPKSHETQKFRLGGVEYPEGSIHGGRQQMDVMQAMRYMLAEDKNPEGKKDERSFRKNQVVRAIADKIKVKVRQNPLYTKSVIDFMQNQMDRENIIADFDTNMLEQGSQFTSGILGVAGAYIGSLGKKVEITFPEISQVQELVVHDPYFGSQNSGVSRVHNIANYPNVSTRVDSPTLKKEVLSHQLPDWMLIPDGGDPYAKDLVNNYWQSVRKGVKETLT